jgi:exodeoxyribonuclease VII small subunit
MNQPFSLELEVKKLEAIESYFQQPDMNLDEAIAKHKEALEIAKGIYAYLEKAESTIEQLDMSASLSADEPAE